jgi:hypothetical protein
MPKIAVVILKYCLVGKAEQFAAELTDNFVADLIINFKHLLDAGNQMLGKFNFVRIRLFPAVFESRLRYPCRKRDCVAMARITLNVVIPAKAGIQNILTILDSVSRCACTE